LKDFKGAGAVLKFNNGGIELSYASSGAKTSTGQSVGDQVGSLPKDSAAVLALAVPDSAVASLKSNAKSINDLFEQFFGSRTGLTLPDDLITVLGSSLSVSLGGDAPASLDDISQPADVPVGLLIHGDAQKIQAVIDKVETRTGTKLSDLPAALASGDGEVSIATSQGYADQLVKKGSLADSRDFKDVVTHLDSAQGVVYVSLDNDWMKLVRTSARDSKDATAAEAADNFAQLRALGMSTWSDGGTSHGLVRLALK
jgi:hypothetical protein